MLCKKQNQLNIRGFTLVELLVAMAVFALAIVAITGIFISVTKTQRKSRIEQRVQAEARYTLDMISREIRDSYIDYAQPFSTSVLHLERPGGQKVAFNVVGNTLQMTIDSGTPTAISSSNVKVADLRFYVTPGTDPFVEGGPNEQPRVTISLTIEDKDAAKAEEQAEIEAQTTISSRQYRR